MLVQRDTKTDSCSDPLVTAPIKEMVVEKTLIPLILFKISSLVSNTGRCSLEINNRIPWRDLQPSLIWPRQKHS